MNKDIDQSQEKAVEGSEESSRRKACASRAGRSPSIFHSKAWLHKERLILKKPAWKLVKIGVNEIDIDRLMTIGRTSQCDCDCDFVGSMIISNWACDFGSAAILINQLRTKFLIFIIFLSLVM